jgi:hypothetical protein
MSQIAEEGRRPVHLGVMVRAEQRRELRERAIQRTTPTKQASMLVNA